MYKIIGANQAEYGPISADQLRQWIAEGRADANTQACLEGSAEWKPLREFPEFAGNFGSAARPPLFTSQPFLPADLRAQALEQVNGPAMGLMISAGLGMAYSLFATFASLLGFGLGSWDAMNLGQANPAGKWLLAFGAVGAIVARLVGIAIGIYIIYGAQKMKKLQSHSLCLGASIVAMLPCVSPCCLIGLPVGIWALVVLNQPAVKEQFN